MRASHVTQRPALRLCLLTLLAWHGGGAAARPADLEDRAAQAYADYFAAARRDFVAAAEAGTAESAGDQLALRSGTVLARPGSGDGVLSRPGGLVHHWRGEIFISGATLDSVMAVSQSYADYPQIFKPFTRVSVVSGTGDRLVVQFRMQASAGGLSATLDVRSRVQYVRLDDRRAYVVSSSEEIREVRNAGRPDERRLPEGHDSGYLWRAGALTRFRSADGGVFMTMETVGLSRPFPAFLGWFLEPIARRLGRSSVEDTMTEFRQAVVARAKLTAMTPADLQLHIRYSAWASRRLMDAVRALPSGELEKPNGISHGSILGTMTHLQFADWIWYTRVAEAVEQPAATMEALEQEWPALQTRWEAFVDGLTQDGLARAIPYRSIRGYDAVTTVEQIVLHLVNHGTLHRGQVMGMIRQLGIEPPGTDLMHYYMKGMREGPPTT